MRIVAHLSVPGMDAIVSGILHPFLTPAHLLILIGIGILLGQHLPLHLGVAFKTFAIATAAALASTTTNWIAGVPMPVPIAIALAAGAMIAAEMRLSPLGCHALFAVAGIAIGLDSGVENAPYGVVIKSLCGTWLGMHIALANVAFLTLLIAEKKKKWMSVGLRVAGSWIVAISLLMLAFALRK